MSRKFVILAVAMPWVVTATPALKAGPWPEMHYPTSSVMGQLPPDLFAFHSNLWLNLHHFLYVSARARRGIDATRAAVTSALADTNGFGALPVSDQNAWRAAVAYYDSTLAGRDILFDSGMVAINTRLARTDAAETLRGAGLEPSLVAMLERATPVYRRVWWPRHDAANQQWEARMHALLARYGNGLATQASRAFRKPWSRMPVRVDVTAYANWAGAYTTTSPSHITVSSQDGSNQDEQGLEILFHEALHTMDDSLTSSLNAAFHLRGKTPPRDPTHVFIFYTAGLLTRRTVPGHVPYAEKNGLWTRVAEFGRALPVLQRTWQPYLDGTITFDEAVQRYATDF